MSHSHGAEHAAGHGYCPFPPAVVEELHKEDVHAGTAIVVLMLSIFLIGVGLYTGICVWVSPG